VPANGVRSHRTDVVVVIGLQALCVALVAGWSLTGHATAPDDGLQQIDLLMLSERVPGIGALEGKPTMVVTPGRGCDDAAAPEGHLSDAFSLVVDPDPGLARRLGLPAAAERCQPGYALVDRDGVVRYRTYDPRWTEHAQEQEILLENLGSHP
jgi:hypothetical protein